MNIVFMGTPDFAVPSLRALIDNDFCVNAVVTQPDRPSGRKRIVTPSPVKQLALLNGIDVLQPEKVKERRFIETLRCLKPDVIAVAAFGQILPEDLLELPSVGCINVHASLLPKYRGAAPIQWALINGEESTGITTMWMDKGLDTGDILLQKSIMIDDNWTSEDLFHRLSLLGSEGLLDTLAALEKGIYLRVPQGEKDVSYAPMLKKEDGLIDWNKSAVRISNLVRGLYPWPCAYTIVNDKEVKLFKVKVHEGVAAAPGMYAGHIKGDGFLVGTAKHCLLVQELQEEGKKRIMAADYLSGHPMAKGDVFSDA